MAKAWDCCLVTNEHVYVMQLPVIINNVFEVL